MNCIRLDLNEALEGLEPYAKESEIRELFNEIERDIVDWLIDDPKYDVYSLTAGGDWLANMFYSGEYIKELPKISPDVSN